MYVRIEYLTRIFWESFSVGGAMRARPLETTTIINVKGVYPNLYAFPRVRLSRGGNAEWEAVGVSKVPCGRVELHKLFVILRPSTRLPRRANPQVEVSAARGMSSRSRVQASRPLSAKEHTELAQTCAHLVTLLTGGVIPL